MRNPTDSSSRDVVTPTNRGRTGSTGSIEGNTDIGQLSVIQGPEHPLSLYRNTASSRVVNMLSWGPIVQFRQTCCFLAVLIFGYVLPTLNSIKIAVTRDPNGIKQYLTYWTVFMLVVYLEAFFSLFNKLDRHPPELKVIFILWLTLPQFNGASRIYSYLLEPLFIQYEADIDRNVSRITEEVKARASSKLKMILWHLFLSSDDGLITSTMFGVRNMFGFSKSAEEVTETTSLFGTSAMRNKLLDDFIALLSEGMFMRVQCNYYNLGASQVKISSNHKMLMATNEYTEVLHEHTVMTLKIPVVMITEVSVHPDNVHIVLLTVKRLRVSAEEFVEDEMKKESFHEVALYAGQDTDPAEAEAEGKRLLRPG